MRLSLSLSLSLYAQYSLCFLYIHNLAASSMIKLTGIIKLNK